MTQIESDRAAPVSGIISGDDRPQLATSGHQAPPQPGASWEAHKIAVVDLIGNELARICGPVKIAEDAGEAGKYLADKLTDHGKDIEDKATHDEGHARDEAHKKMNKDKADAKQHGLPLGMSANFEAMKSSLSELRGR